MGSAYAPRPEATRGWPSLSCPSCRSSVTCVRYLSAHSLDLATIQLASWDRQFRSIGVQAPRRVWARVGHPSLARFRSVGALLQTRIHILPPRAGRPRRRASARPQLRPPRRTPPRLGGGGCASKPLRSLWKGRFVSDETRRAVSSTTASRAAGDAAQHARTSP